MYTMVGDRNELLWEGQAIKECWGSLMAYKFQTLTTIFPVPA